MGTAPRQRWRGSGPEAEGRELFVPSAVTARCGRPEADVLGFNVYRSGDADAQGIRVNRALIAATGGAAAGAQYLLGDVPPAEGTYFYRLEVVNRAGPPDLVGPMAVRWEGVRLFLPAATRSGAAAETGSFTEFPMSYRSPQRMKTIGRGVSHRKSFSQEFPMSYRSPQRMKTIGRGVSHRKSFSQEAAVQSRVNGLTTREAADLGLLARLAAWWRGETP